MRRELLETTRGYVFMEGAGNEGGMKDDPDFVDLIRRIRVGDGEAAAELVQKYEREVRREVRMRLRFRDTRLRRVFDSMDIVQSVLKSFFTGAAEGQFNLEAPDQLRALLATMARMKLAEQVRRQQRGRRDVRRVEGQIVNQHVDDADGPSRVFASRELLKEVRLRLSQEEQRMADLRSEGCTWAQVAADLGGSPDARRKQMDRALDRVRIELGG